MPYARRDDAPDRWHHVMNRGVARRPLFESRRDIRHFLSRLARSVRRGEIEVHAYCVLTTHFHLLVRSPQGRLPAAMRRLQAEYAAWFNRCRRRDGPLFRGRYCSRPVTTDAHWCAVLRYIDANAVDAGLATGGTRYPHGSATHYARPRGPAWLERAVVEERVRDWLGAPCYVPSDYAVAVAGAGPDAPPDLAWRRLGLGTASRRPSEPDPLDDLLRAAPLQRRIWLAERATAADGGVSPQPVVDVAALRSALDGARRHQPGWEIGSGQRRRDGWAVMTAGLLRACARVTLAECAAILRVSGATVQRYATEHSRLCAADDAYGQLAAEVFARALAPGHGGAGASTHQRG